MAFPELKLNDGSLAPQLGFGLWQVPDDETPKVVLEALHAGYRSIDGASIYRNESGLGQALRQSPIPRRELFITTKVWNDDQGYDKTRRAFDSSLKKLQLEYLDLYLIHWPAPKKDLYIDTWKAFIQLQKEGRVKSIGVSNFTEACLLRLIDEADVVPAVNQLELHPRFQQKKLRAFHQLHGIVTESWSPLGQGHLLADPSLKAIANRHQRSVAQIILRWHLQKGLMVIPKSVTPARIQENKNIFDFQLDARDIEQIDGLDSSEGRIGPDPDRADF